MAFPSEPQICTTILSLPIEDVLVPHVFSHLNAFEVWRLRLVCKDFYKAAYCYYTTSCLQVLFTTEEETHYCTLSITKQILSHCWRLQYLSLDGHHFSNRAQIHGLEQCLLIVASTLKFSLKELSLMAICISQNTVRALKTCCNELHKLSLTCITCIPNAVNTMPAESKDESNFSELIADCVTLEKYCSDMFSYSFQLALSKQSNLKVLEVSPCYFFNVFLLAFIFSSPMLVCFP